MVGKTRKRCGQEAKREERFKVGMVKSVKSAERACKRRRGTCLLG